LSFFAALRLGVEVFTLTTGGWRARRLAYVWQRTDGTAPRR
jgi:hypothetical protein